MASAPLPWSAQHLDRRYDGDLVSLVESVAGLNAQTTRGPVVGIAARTGGIDLAALDELRRSYELVKINVMRGTVHLLTARQYWHWRSALVDIAARRRRTTRGGVWSRVDYDDLVSWGTDFAGDQPAMTRGDLGAAAAQRFRDADPADLGFALRMSLPLVEVAPSSSWRTERTRYVMASSVMSGSPATTEDGLADLARSFVSAFSSASVEDFAYWSGLTRSEAQRQSDVLTRSQLSSETGVQPTVVLPEFDNLYFCRRTSDEPLYQAKKDPRLNPARMPGSVIERGRVVAHWTATTSDGLSLTPWTERLAAATRSQWRSFSRLYESAA